MFSSAFMRISCFHVIGFKNNEALLKRQQKFPDLLSNLRNNILVDGNLVPLPLPDPSFPLFLKNLRAFNVAPRLRNLHF